MPDFTPLGPPADDTWRKASPYHFNQRTLRSFFSQGTKPSFIEFKTSLELRGMRSFAGPLQDWLGGLGLPTRSPQFRTPTVNENARQEGKGDTAHQGATVVFSEEAQSKEPSAVSPIPYVRC